jgi:hypothetical protein
MLRLKTVFFLCLALLCIDSKAQLKFLVEDFEGCSRNPEDLLKIGAFTFGNTKLKISQSQCSGKGYSGRSAIEQYNDGNLNYGGWGLGVFRYIQLDQSKDNFNFYYQTKDNSTSNITIYIQDDDDGNDMFSDNSDDLWIYEITLTPQAAWSYITIPLSKFTDANKTGDNAFNISYQQGKLLSLIFRNKGNSGNILTDFICFSKGEIRQPQAFSEPLFELTNDRCAIGAWSEEGQTSGLLDIVDGFNRAAAGRGTITIVHSFHPFSDDGGTLANKFPSVSELSKTVTAGFTPMITIENQFLGVRHKKQPGLKAIADGKYDFYFLECGKRFKQVPGKVLVRLMHEFNGNWYPWCIANNGNSPELYKAAYRRIVQKIREAGATNVYFIWCVNSGSIPQKPWNYIVDAYPGDDVVDIVSSDIYNGAEKGQMIWRSFRKEAAESYFLLTENFPSKPFMICEMASREKVRSEGADGPDKGHWIYEASEALKTDFSKCAALAWFNSGKYKITTSENARKAFINYMWTDPYFRSKPFQIETIMKQ